MDYDSAYDAFKNQVRNAAKKKVPFTITFKDWCDLWTPYLHLRGKMQLQRVVKEKGYVPGNLRIGERPKKKKAVV